MSLQLFPHHLLRLRNVHDVLSMFLAATSEFYN